MKNLKIFMASFCLVSTLSGCASSNPTNVEVVESNKANSESPTPSKTDEGRMTEEECVKELKILIQDFDNKSRTEEESMVIVDSTISFIRADKPSESSDYAKGMNRCLGILQQDAKDDYKVSQIWADLQVSEEKRKLILKDIETINKMIENQDYNIMQEPTTEILKNNPDYLDATDNFRTMIYVSSFYAVPDNDFDNEVKNNLTNYGEEMIEYFNQFFTSSP
jgi:hypothetical protein